MNKGDKNNSLKWIIRGAGIAFIGLFITKILNYIYRLIIAQYLGPEMYGILSIGLAIFGIASIISIAGLHLGLERFVSYYSGNKSKLKSLLFSAWKIVIPLSLFISLILFFFAPVISNKIFENANLIPIIKILAVGLPIWAIAEVTLFWMRGLKLLEYYVVVRQIIETAVKVGLTLILFYLGYQLLGAIFAFVIGFVITFIGTIILLVFVFRKVLLEKGYENLTPKLFNFSWPLLFTGLLFSIFMWTDTFMLGYFLTEDVVGIYNITVPTANLLLIPLTLFGSLFIPTLTDLYAKKENKEIKIIYRDVVRWILMISFPAFLFVLLLSEEIITALFGDVYVGASIPLIILSSGFLISLIFGPINNMFNVFEKTKLKLIIGIVCFLINILLNAILISLFGIIGAALATAFSIVLMSFLNWIAISKTIFIIPWNLRLIKLVFASFVAVGVSYVLFLLYLQPEFLHLIILGIIFIILYIPLLILVKAFSKNDIVLYKSIKKKLIK